MNLFKYLCIILCLHERNLEDIVLIKLNNYSCKYYHILLILCIAVYLLTNNISLFCFVFLIHRSF